MNNPKLIQARARSYSEAIAQIFYEVRESRNPLDQELRRFFRNNKKYGSRDRRFIAESLYSLFRWFGWVQDILPTSAPDIPCENKKFCSGLIAVLCLDNLHKDAVAEHISQLAGVNIQGVPKNDLDDKRQWMGKHFGLKQLKNADLVPDWFVEELPKDFNLEELIIDLQKRPPMWIRLQGPQNKNNTLRELKERDFDIYPHSIMKKAIKIVNPRVNLYELKSFRDGQFEVQDLASQSLGFACQAEGGQRWWDVCAGAGGKTLLLADHMESKGGITSTDIREWKLDDLKKRARRARFSNITTKNLKKTRSASKKRPYDGVLVDAPCSCTGTWRRNPDARWSSTAEDCEELATIQADILEKSAPGVKADGVLVYATCSFSVRENEEIVENFLKTHPDFYLEDFPHPLTLKPTGGILRISPSPEDCDAMFAARFRRKN